MHRCELIIYATPTGELAELCNRYFERAAVIGATTAQDYPPHCTLTGFFRWHATRRVEVVDIVNRAISASGHPPQDSVNVVRLGDHDGWVGLELDSTWLRDWTASLAEQLQPGPDEDALRLKEWLHLSLAYGVEDLDAYREAAAELIDTSTEGGWELGLWERRDSDWRRLSSPRASVGS